MNSQPSPNYTQTTFGQITKKLVNGGTPPTEIAHFWNGKIPWITGADFTTNGIGEFRRFVSETAIAQTATNLIDQGQLLLVTRTGVGKLAIAPCDIAISQDITGVYPDTEKVDVRFLYHRMRLGVEDLKKLNQGTSINGIIRSDLFAYPIQLPTLPQQRRIAEILSTLDEAIEQTEALIAKHQQIKAGLMHDLFTRGVTPDGHLRRTREQAPDLYKESPLGWIPKEWDVGRLSQYLDPLAGIKPGPFGSSLTKDNYVATGFRVYGQEQVIAGTLEIGDYCITEEKFLEMAAFEVVADDVLISMVGTVGCVLVVKPPFERGIINPRLMRLRPARGIVLSGFLKHLLLSANVRRQLEILAGGGTMPVINGRIIRRLVIPLLSLDEQARMIARIDALDETIASLAEALAKFRQQKRGLMDDLLTGTVRVKIEQASARSADG